MNKYFVEPCCAEKQLPTLLHEQSFNVFRTNGDVLFEHFIKSLSCLAGNTLSIMLTIPTVNPSICKTLAWMARRGWLTSLHILANDNQSALVFEEMQGVVKDLHFYHHERVTESSLIIEGEKAKVVLHGKFLVEVEPQLLTYFVHKCPHNAPSELYNATIATIQPFMHNEVKPTFTKQKSTRSAKVKSDNNNAKDNIEEGE